MGPTPSQLASQLQVVAAQTWKELAKPNMAPEPEPKRRKIQQPPPRRIITSAGSEERVDKLVAVSQISNVNFRIQQAKNFAIAQAQQDGCTGNFRVIDSPFGNYFVPVVPTRKDLAA